MKKLLLFIICIIFSLTLLMNGPIFSQAQTDKPIPPALLGKIDPRLVKLFLQNEDSLQTIIIELKPQADLTIAQHQSTTLARRAALIESLQTTAHTSQVAVKHILAEAQQINQATDIQPLWIINAVGAKTSLTTILTLAAREEVAFIRPAQTIYFTPPLPTEYAKTYVEELPWGIEKIKANQVWESFNLEGDGVVVANFDTGVDYLHPDLYPRYRGYRGGTLPPDHVGNWYDATDDETIYPVDTQGHGTHTMGTIVGLNGIGVAPKATWIAVKVFDETNSAEEVWLHEAFEWILAPNGNPNLAPDVLNNSWSVRQGDYEAFQPDLQLLMEAGIIPVFSAGNYGPNSQTIGAPASYDNALAVGAINVEGFAGDFSSRGPSPWGKIKPDLMAPGIGVLSSLPGGRYGWYSGTSMAAPHVAGVIALMLEANDTLTQTQIFDILRQNATPLGIPSPNNIYGWGILDAYRSLEVAFNAGQITGFVRDGATGSPLPDTKITIVPRHRGLTSTITTAETGFYQRGVMAGDYDISASIFGYQPETVAAKTVVTGSVVSQDFSLEPLPTGALVGVIAQFGTGRVLSATITIDNTPATTLSNGANGRYTLDLPAGVYTLTVASPGHRITSISNITIETGQTTYQNLALITAPTILLVDSGAWYNYSQAGYYSQVLQDNRYYFHYYPIKIVPTDVPTQNVLSNYDIVIWSSPFDSPGYLGMNQGLRDFLHGGGHLLLSGQDIGFYDGGGADNQWAYYAQDLKSDFLADDAGIHTISGLPEQFFADLDINLIKGDGADNQDSPDVIRLTDPNFGSQLLMYDNGDNAGLQVGHCLPYRAINLPFGLEGVSRYETRFEIMEKSLNWFQAPSTFSGFQVSPLFDSQVNGLQSSITHTLWLRNERENGSADTYTFTLGDHKWPVDFPRLSITLDPCEAVELNFRVDIPAEAIWGEQDILTIAIRSSLAPISNTVITRVTRAPSSVLLVDDDQWFNYEDEFIQALGQNHITPDHWPVSGPKSLGSPPLSVLERYPLVVWYTAYDWSSPLNPTEEETLKAYLDAGGRLMLSSQEYLYLSPEHKPSQFAQNYLGIADYEEGFSTKSSVGVANNFLGDRLGPYQLKYPLGYNDWSDIVTPTVQAEVAMVNRNGFANALIHHGGGLETWHTAFFGYGVELLNDDDRAELMGQTMGWLSWLGTSTVETAIPTAGRGDIITYTAFLVNDGPNDITTATFTATFPSTLIPLAEGASDGVIEQNGQIIWTGPIQREETKTINYLVQVSSTAPYATLIKQVNWIGYQDHQVWFKRTVPIWLNTPAWVDSTFSVTPTKAMVGDRLTYTLHLTNTGNTPVPLITVTTTISPHLYLLPLTTTQGTGSLWLGSGSLQPNQILWQTSVAENKSVSLTFQTQVISIPYPFTFPLTISVDDGFMANKYWTTKAWVEPYSQYLPLILKH